MVKSSRDHKPDKYGLGSKLDGFNAHQGIFTIKGYKNTKLTFLGCFVYNLQSKDIFPNDLTILSLGCKII